MKRYLCFSLVVLLATPSIVAAENKKDAQNGLSSEYYNDAKRGWFWYETPPPEKKEEKPEEKKPEPKAHFIPSMSNYTLQELWNMYPDDFQELLVAFHKKSVQTPTTENVKDYMLMQDIARRKAGQYAQVHGYVLKKYPEFDLTKDVPNVAGATKAKTRIQNEEVNKTILAAGKEHGLVFFINPACQYCDAQNDILKFFKDRYKWQVIEINVATNPQKAAKFGVETTPSLMLIKKGTDEYFMAGSGVVSLDELERNVYRGIRQLNGQAQPDEYYLYEDQKGGAFDYTSILDNASPATKGLKQSNPAAPTRRTP